MKIHFVTVGAPNLAFVRDGFLMYTKRISQFHKIKITHLKEKKSTEQMLKIMQKSFAVVLDERGKEFTSIELAKFLDDKAVSGVGEIVFLIGGPDGHSEQVKSKADLMWSLSKLTFAHDLAMLLLSEAIYRASTINANHPYHRQ